MLSSDVLFVHWKSSRFRWTVSLSGAHREMWFLCNVCLVVFVSALVCTHTYVELCKSLLCHLNASFEDLCTAVRVQRPREHGRLDGYLFVSQSFSLFRIELRI